jgi:hypothetical protein
MGINKKYTKINDFMTPKTNACVNCVVNLTDITLLCPKKVKPIVEFCK